MDKVLETQFYGANQDYEKSLALMHEHHKALQADSGPNFLMLLEYKPVILASMAIQILSVVKKIF
jgi:hypothetical protein